MKKVILLLICTATFLQLFSKDNNQILKDWKKMHSSKTDVFKVYNDLKFGMFIHWGVYSKLGGTWKGVQIIPETHGDQATLGEWIMYSAQIPRNEYKGIAKTFNPVEFNAEEWVKLAKEAGMRYIVVMPKHHDGFAMYHSKITDYNIYDFTPFKRDPIEEIYRACQNNGMRMGIYYSHSVDWMDGGDAGISQEKIVNPHLDDNLAANTWDPSTITYQDYIENKAKPQMNEILTKFPNLIEIWYDFPRYMNLQQSFDFYKLAYKIQPGCLINSRVGNDLGDLLTAGDNEIPKEVNSKYKSWETPGTMNNTWGFKSYDTDWKTVNEMLFWIVEIASKGGNYLLNVGPDGNGIFMEPSIKILKGIGAWMKINGEAIYGTKRWTTMKEGNTRLEMKSTTDRKEFGFKTIFTPEDFWFTIKNNFIYIISISSPQNNKIYVQSLYNERQKIKCIKILGSEEILKWDVSQGKIEIELPSKGKSYETGFALRVELN